MRKEKMNSSGNMNSPVRKRLSMKNNLIDIEKPTDDEFQNELKNRRLEAINKATDLKRRSIAAPLVTGLNAAQLAQHCNDCIKLSTENKINSKNAFSLLLIDFMGAMAKKTDSEIGKSFQVATSTLDASVKIYGYRVDAVHAEAVKLANGFFSKELQEALDGDDVKEEDDVGTKKDVKTKVKKKKKKVTVVASSSLNTKSESEALLDVVPKPTLLPQNIEGGFGLLSHIPKYNDGCLLMVEADVPCWPSDSNSGQKQTLVIKDDCDPENVMTILRSLPVCIGDRICDDATGIVFRQDVNDADDGDMAEISQTSAFEFDINASVDDIEFEDEVQQRLAIPAGGFDSGDEIVAPPPPVRSACATITDMKRRLAVQNMEYSMFDDKVMKAWAGPTYWKVRPSVVNHSENKENEDACQGAGTSKRTRRGRQKELVELFHVSDDVLQKHLAPASKAVLAKSTLCSWKASNVTLSEDYKYKPQDLFTLFFIPVTVTSLDKTLMVIDDDLEENQEENREELEYCSSQVPIDDDDGDYGEGGGGGEGDVTANLSRAGEEIYNDENMVAIPTKVGKIAVTGLKRIKHVDMKVVKKGIWDVLNESQKDGDQMCFQKLFNTCSSKMPKNVATSMTPTMLFNALLHLTNEKSLTLLQPDKTADFNISI